MAKLVTDTLAFGCGFPTVRAAQILALLEHVRVGQTKKSRPDFTRNGIFSDNILALSAHRLHVLFGLTQLLYVDCLLKSLTFDN